MAVFVSRAQWGARAPRSRSTNITPGNGGVTVHHVDGVRVARGSHTDCASQVRGIQNHHMDTNGWQDIAYNHLTCVHGYVFEGRGEGIRSAANGTDSGNQNWYAVCGLVGGSASNYDTITNGLIDAFHLAISRLRARGGAANGINGHRNHTSTACPGNLYALVTDGRLDPGGGGGTPTPPPWPGVYFRYPPVTSHSSVRTWQQRMRDRGWSITVDGHYGAGSREVCLAFQREKRLTVDGIVGPATWDAAWTAPIT
ncbi:peptidoglycan-binding domain-containing protein [Streptomyces sp. ST2-7A]|uniref:peptidoglycan recognition protein family protein n=1 Tax=Streptomyces sp. ST2-7A TaxID=2907214 RepID=UPI001F332CD5|nr:peptidoglycan-binding domain-containing protein [Streptomyces sp. ST2-7A]MCE7081570.1 peptidoglycan-binding domain-containing protein [Streptomyces sp. ST2-7A]